MSMSLAEIRVKGWEALVKKLGVAGATRFILMYESGNGDYTMTRKNIFKDYTVEQIVRQIKNARKK